MRKVLTSWRKVQQGITRRILTPWLAEEESREGPFHQKEEVRPLNIWTKKNNQKLAGKSKMVFFFIFIGEKSFVAKIVTIKVMDVIVVYSSSGSCTIDTLKPRPTPRLRPMSCCADWSGSCLSACLWLGENGQPGMLMVLAV